MKKLIIVLSILLFGSFSFAKTVTVSTITALQTAINNSATGDTLVLANGTYLNSTLSISKSNIRIKAATLGGVFLNGTNSINISGSNVIFTGFQFTSGSVVGNLIKITGSNNTLSHLNFNGYSADHMITILGSRNIITYCNFQNKPATNLIAQGGTGSMVQIIPSSTVIGYNTIRYCTFQHMPGFGGDYGNECIRIGDGAYSTMVSRTIVEYCYFEDTGNGDSEAISVKSQENVLRFNTMKNNPNAMFVFRNGDNNIAYGNYFITSGGIRITQANNIYCYNNYFQQSGTNQNLTLPGGGTAPIILEYFGIGYGNNFNIINNTFYRCSGNKIATNLTNCTWANNIFYSDSSTIFTGTTAGQVFTGNIYQGVLGLTIPSGMNKVNPLLILNTDNYYGLSATSPAINASSSSYPAILDIVVLNDDPTLLNDISGQTRPTTSTLKDVGCDEYTTGTVTNRPLAKQDIGPTYLRSIPRASGSSNAASMISKNYNLFESDLEIKNIKIFPNPSNDFFTLQLENTIESPAKIEVIDATGRLVFNQVISIDENYSFGSELNKGIYFVKIIIDNKIKVLKVIKDQ